MLPSCEATLWLIRYRSSRNGDGGAESILVIIARLRCKHDVGADGFRQRRGELPGPGLGAENHGTLCPCFVRERQLGFSPCEHRAGGPSPDWGSTRFLAARARTQPRDSGAPPGTFQFWCWAPLSPAAIPRRPSLRCAAVRRVTKLSPCETQAGVFGAINGHHCARRYIWIVRGVAFLTLSLPAGVSIDGGVGSPLPAIFWDTTNIWTPP